MVDSRGRSHEFRVTRRLCATGQVIEAHEAIESPETGYEFAVLGDFDQDPIELFAELYQRMRRGLAYKHLEDRTLGLGLTLEGPIRGRISSDYDSGPEPEPVIVIDGREFTWSEFGRMLLSFEGWQFRLQIVDRTDEA